MHEYTANLYIVFQLYIVHMLLRKISSEIIHKTLDYSIRVFGDWGIIECSDCLVSSNVTKKRFIELFPMIPLPDQN